MLAWITSLEAEARLFPGLPLLFRLHLVHASGLPKPP